MKPFSHPLFARILAVLLAVGVLVAILGLGKEFDNFPNQPSKAGYFTEWDSDEDLGAFVSTAINTGSASVLDTEQYGIVQITGAATTDNSGAELQRDAANFALATSKRSRWAARVKLSDATQSDAIFGTCTLDTSLLASAPSNGIYFRKDDEDAFLDCVIRAGSSDVSTTLGAYTLANDTYVVLAIDINMSSTANRGTVTFYVDGTAVSTAVVSGLPSGIMSASAAMQSGNNTGTKTLTMDFMGVEQAR